MLRSSILPLFALFLTQYVAALADERGSVTGSIARADGRAVAGAKLLLDGPTHAETVSDARGLFHFANLPDGTYALRAQRAGFAPVERAGLEVRGGAPVVVRLSLNDSTFSSLREIGRASATSSERNPIDTGTTPVVVIPGASFADRGEVQVTKALNEVPGSITTVDPTLGGNGASLANPAVPQIRGALSYETASLIDGHPVSVGANGEFSPLLVNPALLQDVEIAKGPTASATEINYAIGGSVNYRTLEPTERRVFSYQLGTDGYGGVDAALRATGSAFARRVDYAFGLADLGSPGPLDPINVAGSQLTFAYGLPPYTIDGRAFAGSPIGYVAGSTPQYTGVLGALRFAEPLYLCCSPVTTGYASRGELGKLRFNLSDATALTISYLGGQANYDSTGAGLASLEQPLNFSTFAPPAGYSGSVAPGTAIPFDTEAFNDLGELRQQNLFQSELRTVVGEATVLIRAYAGASDDVVASISPDATLQVSANAWGVVPLCPAGATAADGACVTASGTTVAPVPTAFSGQRVTLSTQDAGSFVQTEDHVRGASAEIDRPVGSALVSLALDRSVQQSWQFEDAPADAVDEYTLPEGSSQQFTTVLERASGPLTRRLRVVAANYQIWYASHFTGDGGTSWGDAVHAFDAPRAGLSWLPSDDVAVRFAAGASIAPPYLALLSAPAGGPVANTPGAATAYLLNENNGRIAPEEAFGYDLGADWRIRRRLTLSSDVYLTNVRDLFLQQTSQQGTYTPTSGADAGNTQPLYVTQTQNLGHARYAGVESSLVLAPPAGFGFVLDAALMRAYAYAIPPSLYATAYGAYTANLGVTPEVNFQPGGTGFNGISNGRVPYAQGYAEVNFRSAGGATLSLGTLYYGPNNAYNRPPFADVSASFRLRLGPRAQFQLSGENLTGAYAQPYQDAFGGVPVVLANRAAGATTGYLGATAGLNLGPPTVRADFRFATGGR